MNKLNNADEIRDWLFKKFHGCTNHDCVVTEPKKGMGTNGSCKCILNASRSQLAILQSKLRVLLG